MVYNSSATQQDTAGFPGASHTTN